MAASPAFAAHKLVSFDVPGSNGTSPLVINASGQIAGSYSDSTSRSHGFLRQPDGTITQFDAPGNPAISMTGINASGQITGYYYGSAIVVGFIRNTDGSFVT